MFQAAVLGEIVFDALSEQQLGRRFPLAIAYIPAR
jgi:hypothetical protein